jgi:hypothetical protein
MKKVTSGTVISSAIASSPSSKRLSNLLACC